MAFIPSNGGYVTLVLASAVIDGGTFTTSYPSGFTQADFQAGLENYGVSHMMVNDNDKVLEGSGGIALSFGSTTVTVTNNTGATLAAGTKVALWYAQRRGNNVMEVTFAFPNMASIANGDLVTDYMPGVEGYIENVCWVQEKAVTTAAKLSTLNVEIGSTDLTGGVVALTSAACTPMGAVIQGTQVTGNNRLAKGSKISVEASSTTAFVEGAGSLRLRIRLDTVA